MGVFAPRVPGDSAADAREPATAPAWVARVVGRASVARVHDRVLGGLDNYPADRAVLARVQRAYPGYREALRATRRFAREATARMAGAGIRQYVDLDSGIPTHLSVYRLPDLLDVGARTVCVCEDRTAYAHHAMVTARVPGASALLHDPSDTTGLLDHLDTRGTLDLTRPVGVLCTEVLHLLDDRRVRGVVDGLSRVLAPGSRLALAVMGVGTSAAVGRGAARSHDIEVLLGRPLVLRTRAEVTRLLAHASMVPPGLVDLRSRAGTPESARAGLGTIAGLARLDQRSRSSTPVARTASRRRGPDAGRAFGTITQAQT